MPASVAGMYTPALSKTPLSTPPAQVHAGTGIHPTQVHAGIHPPVDRQTSVKTLPSRNFVCGW